MVTLTDVLNTETKRLNDKRIAIDNAEAERKRIIKLNASDVERQRAQNIVYIVFVVMLLVIVLIKLLYRFEIVPDSILDLLIAITIASGIIYCGILYSDILSRSDMDFSQIELERPVPKSAEQLQKENEDRIKAGDLSAIQTESQSGKCIGETCCPNNTFFNTTYNLCVPTEVPIGAVPTAVYTGTVISALKLKNDDATLTGLKLNGATNEASVTDKSDVATALLDSTKYHYCRKSDGTYTWMPITSYNKMVSNGAIVPVTEADPNYVDSTRTAYNRETLSTKSSVDGFTTKTNGAFITKAVGIEPFSPSEGIDYHPYRL